MTYNRLPPTAIKFGTDGWRAIIAEDYTFDNVRACAASVVAYLQAHGLTERGLVVGYDARFASEDFADAVAEVAAAAGVPVLLSDRLCPTPVVSYSIIERKAGGGVVITASHNPWRWNGFKYKPDYGGSASPEIVAELERRLPDFVGRVIPRTPMEEAKASGAVRTFDPRPGYLAQLARLVDIERLKSAGLRVCYDAMYGTGAGYLTSLLDGGRTALTELHGEGIPCSRACTRPSRSPATSPRCRKPCAAAASTSASPPTATPTASASPTRTASSSTSSRCSGCSRTTCLKHAANAGRS
jgi:phosphomannomutase